MGFHDETGIVVGASDKRKFLSLSPRISISQGEGVRPAGNDRPPDRLLRHEPSDVDWEICLPRAWEISLPCPWDFSLPRPWGKYLLFTG